MSQIFVLRTTQMAEVRAFFENFGLDFVEEKHGKGPVHYACEQNGLVFEIYPAKKADTFRFMSPTCEAPSPPSSNSHP